MNRVGLTYDNRLKILSLDSLEKRRKIQTLILVFKIKNNFNLIPENWIQCLKFNNNERTGCYIICDKNRINLCDKSFFNYAKSTFNSLPKIIRNESKLSTFKKLICNYL